MRNSDIGKLIGSCVLVSYGLSGKYKAIVLDSPTKGYWNVQIKELVEYPQVELKNIQPFQYDSVITLSCRAITSNLGSVTIVSQESYKASVFKLLALKINRAERIIEYWSRTKPYRFEDVVAENKETLRVLHNHMNMLNYSVV